MRDIRTLITKPEGSLSVSIFLPTNRINLPHNLKADRVRLKNAIRDIKSALSDKLKSSEIKRYVKHLERLHADRNFWRFRDNGLALFVAKDRIAHFDLPVEIDTTVHVGEHFVITPLLASMRQNYSFYVLELNQHEPRFYLGNQTGLERTLKDEMPGDIKHALLIDEYQNQLQHSTGTTSAGASYHGHGGGKDQSRKDLERYLRMIDDVLWQAVLHGSNRPLVLIGDVKTVEIYRRQSRYGHIFTKNVHGNYEQSTDKEIHERAWQLIEQERIHDEKVLTQIVEQVKNRDGRQLLVSNSSIKKAVRRGRLATLIIGMIGRTYDSVVSNLERRYKIIMPSNLRQLANIEAIAREVVRSGGKIASVVRQIDEDGGKNINYIQGITRSR